MEMMKAFQIGFADEWEALSQALKKGMRQLISSGRALAVPSEQSERSYYDRFRGG